MPVTDLTPSAVHRPPTRWVLDQIEVLPLGRALVVGSGRGEEAEGLARMGWEVATQDPWESSYWWSRAAASRATVSEAMVRQWLELKRDPAIVKRFQAWADALFTAEEATWLGIWHHHLVLGDAPEGVRAQGIRAVFQVMRYWQSWNARSLGPKPLTPASAFRRALLIAPREGPSWNSLRLAPGALPAASRADLMLCYVPPAEGIRSLGRAWTLWEQWVTGDPHAIAGACPPETLGGAWSGPEAHRSAVAAWIGAAESCAHLALVWSGATGAMLERLVTPLRPILARREWAVPYPAAEGSRIITTGVLIAGRQGDVSPAASAKG